MRSALALSALLLLLPPRSLSEGENPAAASPGATNLTLNKPDTASAHSSENQAVVPTVSPTAPSTIKTEPSSTMSALVVESPSKSPTSAPGAPSSAPTRKNTAVTDKATTPPPTTGRPEIQGASQSTLPPTTKSMKSDPTHSQPAGSGTQSSPSVPTRHLPTQGTGVPTPAPPPVSPSGAPPAPSTAAPVGPHQPTAIATLKPSGNSSKEPHKITTISSSLGTKTSSGSALHGAPTTPTSLVASQGNQQDSSKVPAVTGTSSPITGISSPVTGTSSIPGTYSSVPETPSSIPGTFSSVPETSSSETLQPGGPSLGPVATSPVTGPGSFSTHLAPATPQISSTSYTSTPRNDGVLPAAVGQLQCGRPENQSERMLVLNFTKSSPCAKNFSDEKLATLLCRAAKATFNPAQDRCHIRLAPIPESQAVAIKEVTIQTNLLPRDVYELLKDKWDELKEVGVSNMKLGDQGPPEETEDRFSMPLIITIVCMASFLLLVAALYGCCHQRLSQRKDQQRLTEELQTVENGYHDNPTLEVMETSSEMQEKKVVNLNGELGDSWIVPLDNLTKDDLDEEEDTHL